MNNEEADDLRLSKMTQAMREADRMFESVGGSTRHHVRECLLPILKDHGLVLLLDEEVAALRTPPATGAAEMREAARAILADLLFQLKHGASSHAALVERVEMGIAALDLPLPAPEVPEAVRAWAHCHDSYSSTRRTWEADTDMRDWIMKEYGL